MSVQERVKMCQLVDQMGKNSELSKRLGLENRSTFHGSYMYEDLRRKEVNKNETISKEQR